MLLNNLYRYNLLAMALTFDDIIKWIPPEEDAQAYKKVICVLDEHYPKGWRTWEVENLSFTELFGETLTSDMECRLRFAIPTIDLMPCFEMNSI